MVYKILVIRGNELLNVWDDGGQIINLLIGTGENKLIILVPIN